MKKIYALFVGIALVASAYAIGTPEYIDLPDVGSDATLKVCAQNLKNYYYHYYIAGSDRAKYTEDEFITKTERMIDAFLTIDADIYALCEVEAQEVALQQLADSMNAHCGVVRYAAVASDAIEEWDATYDNNIKSGFIYRLDKVRPIGDNHPACTANYYKNTMRIQVFEELASGQRFTLSMNHFKASTSNPEDDNTKRLQNAQNLLNGLSRYATDPDILIMGDLNCEIGSDPLNLLEEAGYEEMLIKYDYYAYSHCYDWQGNLIDHAFANESMAAQITGAGVYHITTSCDEARYYNYNYRYSDHDPYIVGLKLEAPVVPCEEIDETHLVPGGENYNLGRMTQQSISGQWYWRYQTKYGATCQDAGGEDWLMTPIYDLSQVQSVSLSFDHAVGYSGDASKFPEFYSLWVTNDYTGVGSSEWHQITIPVWPAATASGFSSYVNTGPIDVPLSLVGVNTVFAFKYASTDNTTWEIKNLNVHASCTAEGIEDVQSSVVSVQKIIKDGRLYLLYNGTMYNVQGVKVQMR